MPAPPFPEELRRPFADAIEDALGLVFQRGREAALHDGLRRAMALIGEPDPVALLQRTLRGEGAVLVALADVLTVGETYFFRDPQHFSLLRRVLETAERPLRLWSAGCASGAEAYTMSIVAREVFGDDADERVTILATDVSEEAVRAGRAGLYRSWALRGVADDVRARWFVQRGKEHEVMEPLKDLVRFSRLNLLDRDDPSWPVDIDVIFCRNVLVYFSDDAIARTARGLRESLVRDGWLIAGPSDPLLTSHGLVVDASGGFIGYRRGERAPRTPWRPALDAPSTSTLTRRRGERASTVEPPSPAPPPRRAPPVDRAPEVHGAPPEHDAAEQGERMAPMAHDAPADPLKAARALADTGDSLLALDAVEKVIRAHPLEAEAYLLRAVLVQALGRHADVLRDAKRALLLDRDLVFAQIVAASSAAALADVDEIRRALRNARAFLLSRPPETEVAGTSASVGELLATCAELEQTLLGGRSG